MAKNTYWLTDPEGTFAVVEGADERDRWVRTHGWTVAEEPSGDAFVWVRNEENPEVGPMRLNIVAAQDPAWAARGWAPGAPPEPAGSVIAPGPTPAAESQSSKPAATASGDKKE